MKYVKEYNNFKKSDLKIFYESFRDKLNNFLNNISKRNFYIEDHERGEYRLVVHIHTSSMTEIVDIIQLKKNKTNKCIDLVIYKEDLRLPDDINNIISFLFEMIEKVMEPTDDWKYNKLFSINSIKEMYDIIRELTNENYELYNSTNKYNI